MHRAILIAWFPWFLSLVAAGLGVWCVLRFGGARLELGKLRRLPRCEGGGVQSLSFVLTLPLFILLLMFIVQIAELMVGIAVVHYAAFAAARAAIVWLPAEVPPYEPANLVDIQTLDGEKSHYPVWVSHILTFNDIPWERNWKYRKIWTAATMACATISPSRDLARSSQPTYVSETLRMMYPAMVPSASQYPGTTNVIQKKIDYSGRNTWIVMQGIDRDGTTGPTYNPYPGHWETITEPVTGKPLPFWVAWNQFEIGWEDPVTVTVGHYFALLPGPGRFLAAVLTPTDGTPDKVSSLIQKSPNGTYKGKDSQGNEQQYRMYVVPLTASVTLSNEGLKSILPYAQTKD